ncbi:MAG: hypothetical protein U5L96_20995 [Owenweeksia sp.]|nr:hypothetical protein [Owenweeksia sp.]
MKQYFLFYILLASSFYSASAQSLRFYQIDQLSDYEQALEMAIDRNRMIFAVIYKDNGGFEEMVREGVFENDSLRQAYSKTITMAIQQNSSMAMRLHESFGDYSLPIFYYLTPNELLTHLLSGNQTASELIRALATAEANQLEFDSLRTKYSDEGLSKSEWLRLIGFAEMNFDFERTQSLALEFFATIPSKELLSEEVLPVVISYGLNLETPYPHMVIEQRQTLEDTVYNTFYESAYSYNLDLAIANNDSVLLQENYKRANTSQS